MRIKGILQLVLLSIMMCVFATVVAFADNGGSYTADFETDLRSSEIIVNAVYNPSGDETDSFTAFLALYNESGQLLRVVSNASINNTARVAVPNYNDAKSAKAFVWKNSSPVTKVIGIDENTVINPTKFLDFTVDVETGREPVVLQLTDTQIIDAAQERYEDRLGATLDAYYATENMDERCFNCLRKTIEATKPDLILLTGDLVYGSFDDKGTSFTKLVSVMDSFGIPWAPVFGNHDNESEKGADWQCQQLESASNCLFKQRTLTGNGNYSVGITQGGELKRVFFMLDSNGCGGMSEATAANGHSKASVGFGDDQITWYTDVATKINRLVPNMKYSFVYHIQQEIFRNALAQYGTINADTANNPINIDTSVNKASSDFGYIGSNLKSGWDTNFEIYNGMKALGADSHFVGHEHLNSASVVYDGTRFQYGQKSSTYDRANYIKEDGTIAGAYSSIGTPIIGGTVMKMSEDDGSFSDSYIYYCNDVNPEIVVVPGMQLGKELTMSAEGISGRAVTIGNASAYQFAAAKQAKIYVDTAVVANKDVFTFDAYVPSTSNNLLNGKGEFSLRIKPNELDPQTDGSANGYIDFKSSANVSDVKIVFDEWKTYKIDISGFGTSCTEFSFVIAAGNTIYLKDIATALKVNGLSFDEQQLTYGSKFVITTEQVDGESAYEVEALGQDKLYVNTELLKNKSTFSFSVYVPSTSNNKLSGKGEFSLRIKPNELDPQADGSVNGYVDFNSSAAIEDVKVVYDEWKTYTIDISAFGTSCTEFSFVIAGGNTIYLKDLKIK